VRTAGACQAKTRFSELLADMANGETVVVTNTMCLSRKWSRFAMISRQPRSMSGSATGMNRACLLAEASRSVNSSRKSASDASHDRQWRASMKTVGAYEAKTRFSELLREVENGETIIVTRHGFPVARLSPMAKEADDVAAAMEEIHRFRREHHPTLRGITLRELIEEGRE
jgi:prevent-host-death family protein